ncbi:MAG: hypothetical protein R3264_22295, partial [Anaerolineae bacterium]|nr:hypothetical protein [Anaerolineae bacterium]
MLTSNQITPQQINWPGFLALFLAVIGLVAGIGLGYSISLPEGGSPEAYPAWLNAMLCSVPALVLLIGLLFYLAIRYRTRAALLKVWVLFAEANDLWYDLRNSFFSPLFFKEPPYRQVTGVYYGHTLSMWTQHKTYKVSAL